MRATVSPSTCRSASSKPPLPTSFKRRRCQHMLVVIVVKAAAFLKGEFSLELLWQEEKWRIHIGSPSKPNWSKLKGRQRPPVESKTRTSCHDMSTDICHKASHRQRLPHIQRSPSRWTEQNLLWTQSLCYVTFITWFEIFWWNSEKMVMECWWELHQADRESNGYFTVWNKAAHVVV